MKVIHCCYRYFPDRGGSETYTSSLIASLSALGVTSVVAALGDPVSCHNHAGIDVYKLGYSEAVDQGGTLAVDCNQDFVARFDSLIERLQPDVVHFHARCREWSLPAVAAVKMHGIPLVLTYHIASISCPRGDLMHEGVRQCDGLIDIDICYPCKLQQLGASRCLSRFMNQVPQNVTTTLGSYLPKGRYRTALFLRQSLRSEIHSIKDFLIHFDRIVALSNWAIKTLLLNGVKQANLRLSRLGTPHEIPLPDTVTDHGLPGKRIRGLFVGRLDASKGVSILAEAMSQLENNPISLDVYGPLPPRADSGVISALTSSNNHLNIRYRGPLPDTEVINKMRLYDFTVVPSRILETGPFTVIESLQAGTPVIGSDIPAINEIIRPGYNGLLVKPNSSDEWANAFRAIANAPDLLQKLRRNAYYRRSMRNVASEMLALYEELVLH